MLTFSHDPEAGTIYVYFTELEAGQVEASLEYPAHLLLDSHGAIVGCQVALDDELTLANLELALAGDYQRLDMASGQLSIMLDHEVYVQRVALEATAMLDLDANDTVLGLELALPAELRTPARLARLQPHMVALDSTEADRGDGPVVFTQPTEQEEDEAEAPDVAVEAPSVPPPTLRSGFVALVGKPNVGKSTLLNALLGQKVSIVSPRPQTTRVPTRGILSRPDVQIVFVDTPGIHQPSHALGRLMVDLAELSLPNADVIGFMVDLSQPPSELDRQIAQQVQRARGHRLLILNKVDIKPRGGHNYLEAYHALGPWDEELAISARRRLGLTALLDAIVTRLPIGPALYPDERITDQSEQQIAAEFVREKVLFHTQHEVPHAVAVGVDEWEEREPATFIRMTITVERDGQKAIIIGAHGSMLKKIGSAARFEIERMLGRKIYLELWVKVRPNWRDDPAALGWLGYQAKHWR
ncbi:GTPase Era [Candidatus Viridilinea mediisalina]|uniref:GTPase Era n=1 Tax=Candidatus Viridilinea mediisalina TaxID=2024553 RepID=A0A2A6RG84_9CHLR|nr:GTPase Era [Candidatus Viridilinea mediisalina]PDW01888.1 GTPase Era [Candidatus Viridilinea mediisalina]